MNNFENKTIWLTGASSGIGEELCIQLAKQGARLILSSRNVTALEIVKSRLKDPEKHRVVAIDLEKSGEIEGIVQAVMKEIKTVHYLFNNGGLSQRSKAIDTSLAIDRKIMEINYFGNIAMTKAILPYMLAQKEGHIIAISSISGKFGFFLRSAYSASKHALHGFYESLLLEEEGNGINVTIVCPGKISTNISVNALTGTGEKHGAMDNNQATGMPVEECVQQLLKAVAKKKKEVLIGNKEIKAVTIKRFFPALFWRIIKKQSAV
ncbi:MAG: SDR family oxidoreductase [Bacteroidota bacterium]